MINAEKLLGQVLGGVFGKGSGKGKKKLMNELTSGAGLMTAIGLAVGAYEVLKDKKGQAVQTPPPPPLPVNMRTGDMPVPPIPTSQPNAVVQQPGSASVPSLAVPPSSELSSEEIARRMIQVMVAAANADGAMDEREEKAILDKLRDIDLSQEEKMYLLDELHHPQDVASLVAGITSLATAKVMYMLACSAIDVDTEAEKKWLDELARGLGISPAVQRFIEEQNESA